MLGKIPQPVTEGRGIVALDYSNNPKVGQKIFDCDHFHNHAAKANQGSYPWPQCFLAIGFLKKVKSRWACLPLDFRFYMMKKDIVANSITAERQGKFIYFESKRQQAATILKEVHDYYQQPLLVVADSWFENDRLWSRFDRGAP